MRARCQRTGLQRLPRLEREELGIRIERSPAGSLRSARTRCAQSNSRFQRKTRLRHDRTGCHAGAALRISAGTEFEVVDGRDRLQPRVQHIGNTLERGFGHTPYGDHFANVCALQVVLPNGELVETGFGGLPGAQAGEVYRWGAGPSLDGLFSQSNFGIVVRMTVWLMPAPEYFQAYFFQSPEDDSVGAIIEALRPLRMNGTLRSTVHIANDYKILNGIQQFPEGEEMPLLPAAMKRYRERLKFGRWNGSGALYGNARPGGRGAKASSRRA